MAKKETTTKNNNAEPQENSEGFNFQQFLTGIKEELSKVVWPSRQQLISESAAVILMVSLVATLIYFVDNLFAWVAGKVFL
ncbi:MAG: preprotein translocase subunit SecE [Chroococcales cyanobacterium]